MENQFDIISHWSQNTKIFQWLFIIGIFQFQCKSEHKQLKRNKLKQNMCKF